jgi:lysophospholipase L1-like esterase
MTTRPHLNLFFYSDSLAFRRPEQAEDTSFTYPFLLKDMLESTGLVRVNVLLRGMGGADMPHICRMVERDAGYFRFSSEQGNIAVVQVGVVDCAPRPFTFRLKPILNRLPFIGPWIASVLFRHRARLQRISSYQITPRPRFARDLRRVLQLLKEMRIHAVLVGIPLPPDAIELRSPGFQRAALEYNQLMKDCASAEYCDVEAAVRIAGRAGCLMQDGHHLTENGHRLYAEALFEKLMEIDPSLAPMKRNGLPA